MVEELRRVRRIIEAFRRRPLRSLILLAVIVYVTGLMLVLVIGLFVDSPPMIFRE
jgi:hypothetical protein